MNQNKISKKIIIRIVCGLLLFMLPVGDATQVTLLPNSTGVTGGYRQALGDGYPNAFPFSAMVTPTAMTDANLNALSNYSSTGQGWVNITCSNKKDAYEYINYTLSGVGSVNYIIVNTRASVSVTDVLRVGMRNYTGLYYNVTDGAAAATWLNTSFNTDFRKCLNRHNSM